jgi:hypothetical protein
MQVTNFGFGSVCVDLVVRGTRSGQPRTEMQPRIALAWEYEQVPFMRAMIRREGACFAGRCRVAPLFVLELHLPDNELI